MRVGPWITCCLGLLASNAPASAQQSPYQSNTHSVKLPPVITIPVISAPSPSPPILPIVYQPIQTVANPPVPPASNGSPQLTVVAPYAPTQPLRPNNDNFFVRLVGHLVGPTDGDGAISNSVIQVSNDNTSSSPAPISENACVSCVAIPPTTTNCCCAHRPYTPLSSYFDFLRFRAWETGLGRLRPSCSSRTCSKNAGPGNASPGYVNRDSPQPRSFDNSFRNGPNISQSGNEAHSSPIGPFFAPSNGGPVQLPFPTTILNPTRNPQPQPVAPPITIQLPQN